jgi:hypothetical protein
MIRGRKGNGSGEVAGAMKRDTRAWEPDPLDHGGLVSMKARPSWIDAASHLVYSTSPAITTGSDLRSFIGSQLCALPCMSVATTR